MSYIVELFNKALHRKPSGIMRFLLLSMLTFVPCPRQRIHLSFPIFRNTYPIFLCDWSKLKTSLKLLDCSTPFLTISHRSNMLGSISNMKIEEEKLYMPYAYGFEIEELVLLIAQLKSDTRYVMRNKEMLHIPDTEKFQGVTMSN